MKTALHNIIGRSGYTLLKTAYMPNGISLVRDISKDTPKDLINLIFDVGAHYGVMTTYFASHFPKAQVYSFEPVSRTFETMKDNTGRFPNVKQVRLGFSSENGDAKVYLQADSGLNSLNSSVNTPDENAGGKFEVVPIRTIDSYCEENNIESIGILKTDAEGLDLAILQGAERMLRERRIRYILSEVGFHPDNTRNTSFDALRDYLFSHNFKLKAFYDQSDFGRKPFMTCANALFLLQEKK